MSDAPGAPPRARLWPREDAPLGAAWNATPAASFAASLPAEALAPLWTLARWGAHVMVHADRLEVYLHSMCWCSDEDLAQAAAFARGAQGLRALGFRWEGGSSVLWLPLARGGAETPGP